MISTENKLFLGPLLMYKEIKSKIILSPLRGRSNEEHKKGRHIDNTRDIQILRPLIKNNACN